MQAPPFAAALHLSQLGSRQWRIVAVVSLLPVAAIQAAKAWRAKLELARQETPLRAHRQPSASPAR